MTAAERGTALEKIPRASKGSGNTLAVSWSSLPWSHFHLSLSPRSMSSPRQLAECKCSNGFPYRAASTYLLLTNDDFCIYSIWHTKALCNRPSYCLRFSFSPIRWSQLRENKSQNGWVSSSSILSLFHCLIDALLALAKIIQKDAIVTFHMNTSLDFIIAWI